MQKRRILKKIIFSLLIAVTIFGISMIIKTGIIDKTNPQVEAKKQLSANSWSSNLSSVVKMYDTNTKVYIDIDNFYNATNNTFVDPRNTQLFDITNKANIYLKINNGLDLYYFSELCNSDYRNDYLTFNYVLGNNIEYTDASRTFKLIKPIGWAENPFSGTFDGQGFTITDLFFYKIDDEEDYLRNFYKEASDTFLEYMALFSVNTGVIKNVGFINSNNIQTTDTFGEYYFVTSSIVVGHNQGTIDHVYVQDLRGDNAGITVEGTSTFTSPLVGLNFNYQTSNDELRAKISNCYVAVNYISSTSVMLSDESRMYPVVVGNVDVSNNNYYGIIDNVYYDQDILLHHTWQNLNGTSNVPVAIHTSEFQNYSGYFNNSNKWYTNGTYTNQTGSNSYATYLQLRYPSLLGFDVKESYGRKNFVINSAAKFIYFSMVMDYAPFRTANYLITNTINMDHVAPESFKSTNDIFQGIIDGSVKDDDVDPNTGIILTNATQSTYNTIINFKVKKGISYSGFHNYGLFGVFGGTIRNLNMYNVEIDPLDLISADENSFNEITSMGIICGTLLGGTIENVNVNGVITINNGSQKNYMGTVYAGGLVGYSEDGVIRGSTSSGSIIGSTQSKTTDLMPCALGGIIGYNNSCDEVSNCLSAMDIEAIRYDSSNVDQYIGGVIGYAMAKSTYKLQNNGNIYIGVTLSDIKNDIEYTDNSLSYGKVYVGGITGLIQKADGENWGYYNNGNIHYYVNNNNYKAYITGAFNAITTTAKRYDSNTSSDAYATIQSNIDAEDEMIFSSISSAGTLYIQNQLSSSLPSAKLYHKRADYFSGSEILIDIRSAGLVYSYLTNMSITGLYTKVKRNVNEYQCIVAGTYNGTSYNTTDDPISQSIYSALSPVDMLKFERVETLDDLEAQEIDISMLDEYAPCVNSDNQVTLINGNLYFDTNPILNKSNTFKTYNDRITTTVNIECGYNLRSIDYITNKNVLFYTLLLSGNLNGRNFNADNLRNEGDINVNFTMSATTLYNTYESYYGDTKKIKVFGCLEEINLDHRVVNAYNGGEINVQSGDDIVIFSVYAAGICYKNVGNDDSVTGQGLMLSSGYKGSLHNSINNGNISVKRINGGAGHFYGQSRIGGLTCYNCSTISSCYNLGNITNINEIVAVSSTYGSYNGEFEVETGGFCFIMQNDPLNTAGTSYTRANIIDSANNGTIISGTASVYGWINASGFFVRNERCESGTTTDTNEGKLLNVNAYQQKIENCINYGDVYAYNSRSSNPAVGNNDSNYEPDAKAAGFVCLGVCSIIDVINYGKIYSTKVCGGMYGYIFFSRMMGASDLSATSPVYIANAINYGEIANMAIDSNTNNLSSLISGNTTNIPNSGASTATQSGTNSYPAGALIGMIRSNGTSTTCTSLLNCLNIKNLINFYDNVNMFGRTYGFATATANDNAARYRLFQYMATTADEDTCINAPFSSFTMNGVEIGIKSYSKDTAEPDNTSTDVLSKTYNGGIFNESYTLRTPPALIDASGNIVDDIADADPNNTDNYIADYLQFIPYSKVNDYLVDKIGLSNTIYQNAFASLLVNAEVLNQILLSNLESANDTEVSNIYTDILNHSAFTTAKNALYMDSFDTLFSILSSMLQNHQNDDAIYNYLISLLNNSDQYGTGIFDDLSVLYETINLAFQNLAANNSVYTNQNVLNNNTYRTLFETIINNDEYLESYVEFLGQEALSNLINTYLSNLSSTEIIDLFNELNQSEYISQIIASTSDEEHLAMMDILFSGVGNDVINDLCNSIDTNSTAYVNSYADGLSSNQLTTLLTYYLTNGNSTITNNNVNNNKTNFYLSNDAKFEVLVKYYLANGNITSIYNLLNDEQKLNLYNNIYNNSGTNQEYNGLFNNLMRSIASNNNVYIKVDSVIYAEKSKPNYETYLNGVGELMDAYRYTVAFTTTTISSTSTFYSGQYTDTTGTPASGNYHIRFEYTTNTSGSYYCEQNNNYRLASYSWLSSGSSPYFTRTINPTGTNSTYVYFNKSSSWGTTYYTKSSYGTYAKVGDNTSTFDFNSLPFLINITSNNKRDLLTRTMDNYASLSTTNKELLIRAILSEYLGEDVLNYDQLYTNNNITKAILNSASSVFTDEEKLNIIKIFISLDNSNYFQNQYIGPINQLTNEGKLNVIKSYAKYDAAFYKIILDTILPTPFPSTMTQTEIDSAIEKMQSFILFSVIKSPNASALVLKEVISNYTLAEQKEAIEGTASRNMQFLKIYLETLHNNNLLTDENIEEIYRLILETDITILDDLINALTLNGQLSANDKRVLIAKYASHNETLFRYVMTTYFGVDFSSGDYEELFETIIVEGVDKAQFTDQVGIYALASSYGIKNGMFIPDNINMIGLDEYTIEDGIKTNHPEWRGGTAEEPNAYSMQQTDKVNYKVYYMMKQLKKSISTVVFKIELVDNDNDPNYHVTNSVDNDYNMDNHTINFYIPSNADELKQEYLYINTNSNSYELAYLATFDSTPGIYVNGLNHTYNVGDIITQTFVVQAEDTTVKQTYTVRIIVTAPKSINSLNDIIINDTTTLRIPTVTNPDYSLDSNINAILIYDADSSPYILAENGSISVGYKVYNYQNGTDLGGSIKLYKYNSTTYPTTAEIAMNSAVLVNNTLYTLNNSTNNGIVVMEEGATYDSTTGNWIVNDNGTIRNANGDLRFSVDLANNLSTGTYILEFTLNSDTKYITVFQKQANTNAKVISVSFGRSEFINTSLASNNNADPLFVDYGYPLTEDLIKSFDDYDNVDPDSRYQISTEIGTDFIIQISPLATGYTIGNVSWTRTNGYITYLVPITVTSESGSTETFSLSFKETEISGALINAYENGRVIEDNGEINGFDYHFSKYDNPSYTFSYDMNHFYFTSISEFMNLELVNGEDIINGLNRTKLLELNELAFTGLTENEINNLTTSEKLDLQINALKEMAFVIATTEGDGVMVSFTSKAPSTTYHFTSRYYETNNFKLGDTITWDHVLDNIYLIKDKNTDSYLETIAFTSDSVVTSLDTIASPNEIAVFAEGYTSVSGYDDYTTLVKNMNGEREIICLPSKIFYNAYDIDINKLQTINIIGLVDKTAVSEYSPVFQIPEDSEIYLLTTVNGTKYQNVMYDYPKVVDGVTTTASTVFLVNEAGTTIRLIDNDYTLIQTDLTSADSFTYDGITYTKSEYAGTKNSLNLGLYYDFSIMREESNITGISEVFNYADYRVYSEAYDITNVDVTHYTDFMIAVQDISNNVVINVFIDLDSTMSQSDISTFNESLSRSYLYFLLTNFIAADATPNVYDQFNNMMGSFVSYDDVNDVFTISKFKTNTSGRYEIEFTLPAGYSFTFIAKKKTRTIATGVEGDSLEIGSMITSQIIDLYITITKVSDPNEEWGRHYESIVTTDPTL